MNDAQQNLERLCLTISLNDERISDLYHEIANIEEDNVTLAEEIEYWERLQMEEQEPFNE